jgi:hypothetical protein
MKAGRSPKFNMPIARAPSMTVKFSHERNVLSLAKNTLGSTRVGRAIRLPAFGVSIRLLPRGGENRELREGKFTWRCLEKRLTRHDGDEGILQCEYNIMGYDGGLNCTAVKLSMKQNDSCSEGWR